MTAPESFVNAAVAVLALLGSARMRELADRMTAGWPDASLRGSAPGPGEAAAVQALLDARTEAGMDVEPATWYLHGLAEGYARQEARCQVDTVWSGPTTHAVPVQATATVLTKVIEAARHELVLMTYSAKPYEPVREALAAAVARGVSVTVIVETLQGAGSAISGDEPALAFANLAGVELWHWPPGQRTEPGAKLHAKLAAADRNTLLITSANLTASGAAKNIEAGVLIRGGTAPERAIEHVHQLQTTGLLTRL